MRSGGWAVGAVAAAALLAAGCGRIQGVPTGSGGSLYRVGDLSFELPGEWAVSGDESRLTGRAPDGRARVEAARLERVFASDGDCLAQADEALARGAGEFQRARRHPTRLGDRSAVTMEADSRGWHGWAWAACHGRRQYRLSFFGVSPMPPEVVAAQRALVASARFGERP